jgi:hypothetical protein
MGGEGHFARDTWERSVDELLEVGFFVLDVEQWLTRAEGCFAILEDAGRLVAV